MSGRWVVAYVAAGERWRENGKLLLREPMCEFACGVWVPRGGDVWSASDVMVRDWREQVKR